MSFKQLQSMHFCIVTNELAPDFGGVADFSFYLIEHLMKCGHRVSVVIPETSQFDKDLNGQIIRVPNWSYWNSFKIADQVAWIRPDVVWLQWVPQMYGKRGVHFGIAKLMQCLRRKNIVIWTQVHEAYVQRENILNCFLHFFQKHSLKKILQVSSKNGVSISFFIEQIKKLSVKEVVEPFESHIPSNIPNKLVLDKTERKRQIVVFSPYANGALTDLTMTSIQLLIQKSRGIRVVILGGNTKRGVLERFGLVDLAGVESTERISFEEVSKVMNESRVALQLYSDGASTRRTSLMAALAHGLLVVSNQGQLTNSNFNGSICWVKELTSQSVVESILSALEKYEKEDLAEKVICEYQMNFGWEAFLKRWGISRNILKVNNST